MNTEFDAAFFDDSARAWRENKIVLRDGMFRYKKNAFTEKTPVEKQEVLQVKNTTRSRPFLLRAAKKQR